MAQTEHILRPFSAFVATSDNYLLTLEQERKAPKTREKYALAFEQLRRFAGEVNRAASTRASCAPSASSWPKTSRCSTYSPSTASRSG
jgi:hypothetical protein